MSEAAVNGVDEAATSEVVEPTPVESHVRPSRVDLKITGRATSIATLTGDMPQSIRNHVASLVLGLAPVRKLAANVVSEISTGYAHSPLNGANGHVEPTPGQRAPIRAGEPLVGAGKTPRFVLFGRSDDMATDLLERYADLVEPKIREPYTSGGLWLIRPDGYVALAVASGDWKAVESYLGRVS